MTVDNIPQGAPRTIMVGVGVEIGRDSFPLPQKSARREKASNPVWIVGEKAIPL